MFSYNVAVLVSTVAPLVSSFIVTDGEGSVDKDSSVENFISYLEACESKVVDLIAFHGDLLDSVNEILAKKGDNVRVPMGDLCAFLANRFLPEDERLEHAGSVADHIAGFIKARSEGPKDHVASERVLYSWQEKGRGSGVCLVSKVKKLD